MEDFRTLLVLRAARETGVLDALVASADTPAAVAEQAGVTERAAEVVVAVLVDRGFLTWVSGAVEPTNRMLGFITKTDVRSIGSLPHALDVADALVALPAAMEGDDVPAGSDTDRAFRNRLGAAAARDDAAVRAAVTAAVHERPGAESVVVVGDDAGHHAVECARRGFDVAAHHDDRVVDAIRPVLAAEPVELVGGGVAEPVDAAADLAVIPHTLSRRSPTAAQDVVRAASESVSAAGGTVAVVDTFGSAPGLSAALLATTPGGAVRDADRVASWLADAGLTDVRTSDVPGTEHRVVAGRRRAVQ
ncbi:hypothetical protein PNP59_07695 [Halobacterium salinarum]|uniref:hypothetical protein n=1 Tax=Halobacterium TaxID=2239 RepID=UPI00255651DD|nr:hypothetical protein [Halobacterium salinarum]MDL0130825.1 hypothetical protein [Halobacterium salinarum]MDL0145805.1 hypothetical protein [Halobacterium salinarum]